MGTNDLLKRQLDETAWREITDEFPWILEALKKYGKKLDQEFVSNNPEVLWTLEMLKEFEHRISWTRLPQTDCDAILAVDCLERFVDYQDWDKPSENESVPLDYDTIDRLIDKWNWATLIDHSHWRDANLGASHLYSYELLERYANRIPADALEEFQLWFTIEEQCKRELHRQVACGEAQLARDQMLEVRD